MQIFAGVREIWGIKEESGCLRCRFSYLSLAIFSPRLKSATHSICVKLLHKHDKLTQCCRAFILALARLSSKNQDSGHLPSLKLVTRYIFATFLCNFWWNLTHLCYAYAVDCWKLKFLTIQDTIGLRHKNLKIAIYFNRVRNLTSLARKMMATHHFENWKIIVSQLQFD